MHAIAIVWSKRQTLLIESPPLIGDALGFQFLTQYQPSSHKTDAIFNGMMPLFSALLNKKRFRHRYPGSGTFAHGIHPRECKELSSELAIEILPTPDKIVLPLQQHIGGPCKPLVKPKQEVMFGDMVGKGEVFVSASLHSPVNGITQKMAVTTLPNGRHMQAIVIKSAGEQLTGQDLWDQLFGGKWPQKSYQAISAEEISDAILDAGIVGLGGAAFPTHVKITPPEKKPIHTLIVNGCECEPYLTTDYRVMVEAPEAIVAGAVLATKAVRAKRTYIGIENNKMEAVSVLRNAAAGAGIQIAVVKTKYPQGSEKHLIKAVLNKEVPLGGLPADIGVMISNVATLTSVARAVMRKLPLTHRVVCVTGEGIVEPKNLLVPIGVAMGDLIDYCGGLRKTAARIVAGGPMMGFSFTNPNTVVTKGTSGITVLTHEDIRRVERNVCIRCGRCVDVCPMNLVPTKIAQASWFNKLNLARQYNINACFECGSCAYICPSGLPLVQNIRMGKAMIAAEGK